MGLDEPLEIFLPSQPQEILMQSIPSTGTIQRCSHDVYLGARDVNGKSAGCQQCYPLGPPDAKAVVLPRSSADPLTTAAGANRKTSNSCPKCGSVVYVRVNEKSDARRECAECGTKYKGRCTPAQQVRALLGAA